MKTVCLRLSLLIAAVTLLFLNATTRASAESTPPGADTLKQLSALQIPARDPVDLAKRLLGVSSVPPTPASPKAYQIGDQAVFTVSNADRNESFDIIAQLRYVTPHVYMWFAINFDPKPDAVKRSAEAFENTIYPTVHKYFGSEASPGVDNDEHLYIVNAGDLGSYVAAYYESDSEYPKVIVPHSNEHQMFLVNLDNVVVGTSDYTSYIAHEFQHMVQGNVDGNESTWLNEGLSELSSNVTGDKRLGWLPEFFAQPETQLNMWGLGKNGRHYGAAFSFVGYFLQRFGDDALHKLVNDPENGFQSVRKTLLDIKATDAATNKPVTLEEFFADWTDTNLLNNKLVGDGRYAYTIFNQIPPVPKLVSALANGELQSIRTGQWGTTYLSIKQPGTYSFKFTGKQTVSIVPTSPHSGKWMWWSNNSDSSDTRLTRAFDLSGAQKATLNYWAWYAIEKDWDYAYVEVSTDNGQTWKALPADNSVPGGGHNNPYGPAYTGFSNSETLEGAQWVKQTVDLSAYAGKQILLRFELLTDGSTTLQGLLLDDISIPEINYSTDAESGDDNWQAEGWIRMDNTLPQTYLVQMIEYSATPKITRLLNPTDGTSNVWDITVGDFTSQVVISVSGMTEFTTEPALFDYTLTKK